MPPWISEHLGEILLLIYILYPFFKRWRDRRKERREKKRQKTEQAARQKTTAKKRPRRGARRVEPPAPRPKPDEATPTTRPSERDYLGEARRRIERLKRETNRLLERAEADPRLARLVPALRDDLLRRVEAIERSLVGTPTLSTIVQDTTIARGLDQLLRTLRTMAQQRAGDRASFLADADAIADACYAPILELARAQGLKLTTSQPVAVTGDWGLSIVPRFASTRVAPLRLPTGFDRDVRLWPAIAHEVGHDFYFSLESMGTELRGRLGLPAEVGVPTSEAELQAGWLRRLFGAWIEEVFADLMGTVILGPAFVEAQVRAFASPEAPQRTAAILQDGGTIDGHPPERLRVYMTTRVLHHLGRHGEADDLWARWEAAHPEVRVYYLPLGGDWVGISEEAVHEAAEALIDTLLLRPWPELEGFGLTNVPGLAYLHDEHAVVERLIPRLVRGELVDADPRWITAAAVLAATANPSREDTIRLAARASIQGAAKDAPHPTPSPRQPTSFLTPQSLQEAITLDALLGTRTPRKNLPIPRRYKL